MKRVVPCPFRTNPADGPCESRLTVTLTDEMPAQYVSHSGCRVHNGGDAKAVFEVLRPASHNPHFVVVTTGACPWCDGTGMYARAWPSGDRPASAHACVACDTKLGNQVIFVPCGPCKGTGQRAA